MDEKTPIVIENKKSIEDQPARWKSAVSVLAVVVIVVIMLRMFLSILIPILIGILLIANSDIVIKIIRAIYKLYKDETYKGLLATLVAVVAFVPFMGFLFLRSVYNMFIAPKMAANTANADSQTESKSDMTTTIIGTAIKEKVKDILNGDEKK